jgi:hypothetical protein
MRNLYGKLAVLILAIPGFGLIQTAQADHRPSVLHATGGHYAPYRVPHYYRYVNPWHDGHYRAYQPYGSMHDRQHRERYGDHYAYEDHHDRHDHKRRGHERHERRDHHGNGHAERKHHNGKYPAYAESYRY